MDHPVLCWFPISSWLGMTGYFNYSHDMATDNLNFYQCMVSFKHSRLHWITLYYAMQTLLVGFPFEVGLEWPDTSLVPTIWQPTISLPTNFKCHYGFKLRNLEPNKVIYKFVLAKTIFQTMYNVVLKCTKVKFIKYLN